MVSEPTCHGNINLAQGGKATASSFENYASYAGDAPFAFAGEIQQLCRSVNIHENFFLLTDNLFFYMIVCL